MMLSFAILRDLSSAVLNVPRNRSASLFDQCLHSNDSRMSLVERAEDSLAAGWGNDSSVPVNNNFISNLKFFLRIKKIDTSIELIVDLGGQTLLM